MKKINLKIFAIIIPIAVITAMFLYSYIARPFSSSGEFCWIKRRFKIECPSCGLTRAIWCLMHGDWAKGFYYHALFTVGFIPFTLILTAMGINYALANRLAILKYRWIYFYLALAVLLAFTVYRNLTTIIF